AVRVLAAHAEEHVDALWGEAALHDPAADVVQPDDWARLVSRSAGEAGEVESGHVVGDQRRTRVRAVDGELDVAEHHVARVAQIEPEGGERAVHRHLRIVALSLGDLEAARPARIAGRDDDHVLDPEALDRMARESGDRAGARGPARDDAADRDVAKPTGRRLRLVAAAIAEPEEEGGGHRV